MAIAPQSPPFDRLVVASHNEGKVREIRDLLRPFGITTTSAGELGLDEPKETETTFIGNATIKAVAAARASGLPALSDDSGLAIDALNGAPGIYAANWAEVPPSELDWTKGPRRDFDMAMWHVHDRLSGHPAPHRARFICALCLAFPDGTSRAYEGVCEGQIVWPPRGDNGFGYDPIFQMDGERLTCGEMTPAAKHARSHRADAFAKFLAAEFS